MNIHFTDRRFAPLHEVVNPLAFLLSQVTVVIRSAEQMVELWLSWSIAYKHVLSERFV